LAIFNTFGFGGQFRESGKRREGDAGLLPMRKMIIEDLERAYNS
jgi:hypothetical protein